MGKYLTLWEIDLSRVPEDPKEQFDFFAKLKNMVEEDMKSGVTKDFGTFFGGDSGYAIDEGTEEEVAMVTMKYCPLIKCKVKPVLSTSQINEIMKKFENM